MRHVTPFPQREMRDGIIDVRDASVLRMEIWSRGVGEVEAGVEVGRQSGVADARLAEGGHGGLVAEGEEVEAGDCGDGAAKGVPDEDEVVGSIAVKRDEHVVHYFAARVLPGGVEAGVNCAVCAFRRRGIVCAGVGGVLLRHRG